MRLTFFSEAAGEYILRPEAKDLDAKDLLQELGRLEDYKDTHEPASWGSFIKKVREEKGLTQENFARLLSVPRSCLAQYETDRVKPSFKCVHALYASADVPLLELRDLYRRIEYHVDEDFFKKAFALAKKQNNQTREATLAGQYFKYEREFFGIKKSRLAEECAKVGWPVTPNRLSKIEKGEPTHFVVWLKLAAAFDRSAFTGAGSGLRVLASYLTSDELKAKHE